MLKKTQRASSLSYSYYYHFGSTTLWALATAELGHTAHHRCKPEGVTTFNHPERQRAVLGIYHSMDVKSIKINK